MDPRRRGERRFEIDPWRVVEPSFDPAESLFRETVFTLANGFTGIRGSFPEGTSAESNPGVHLAGVWFQTPDTATFAKGPRAFPDVWHGMATCPDPARIVPRVGGESLDMAVSGVTDASRALDLRTGIVTREVTWAPRSGGRLRLRSTRCVPMDRPFTVVHRTELEALEPVRLDLAVGIEKRPGDHELGAGCWASGAGRRIDDDTLALRMGLPDSAFKVAAAGVYRVRVDGRPVEPGRDRCGGDHAFIDRSIDLDAGRTITIEVFASVRGASGGDAGAGIEAAAITDARAAAEAGSGAVLDSQRAWWAAFWRDHDVVIDGDDEIQQGVRFCLFQVAQSRRPGDDSVSIGTNGLTGAMHGGLFFWDTEIYVLPALLQFDPAIARELLVYRHRKLPHARDNARRIGYGGAAYPWFTINGDPNPGFYECTVGEQHINAAIPWAIDHYLDHVDDEPFVRGFGAEILVEQARFWATRFTWSDRKGAYVINQVTGPDEYTAFNNNSCYTNATARWTLRRAADAIDALRDRAPEAVAALAERIGLDPDDEPGRWRAIAGNVYIPWDDELGIHPQDDAFLDLDPVDLPSIDVQDIPLEVHWPWERVIRSRLLKQADVVLLHHVRWDEFSEEERRADYRFYEPITTHDSSLSASVHALIAADIGNGDDAAYYLYRSTRLDLDNINLNTGAGIHLANCGGAWMAIVHGVAGLRARDGRLRIRPSLPPGWNGVAFAYRYRERTVRIEIDRNGYRLALVAGEPIPVDTPTGPILLAAGKDHVAGS